MVTETDLRRALDVPSADVAGDRHAAVAAVFDANLDLLLMRRAQREGDPWSGHVSLPGGREEPQDEDHVATAMRETHEEVGLELGRATLVGALDDLAAVGGRPGLVIHPYVFVLEGAGHPLSHSVAEVASTRWVSLAWLLSDETRDRMHYQRHGYDMMLPRVRFPGASDGWDRVPLWGLTLRIIDDLLHRLDGRGVGLDRIRGVGG